MNTIPIRKVRDDVIENREFIKNYCIRYDDDLSCCESHVPRFVAVFVYALLINSTCWTARLDPVRRNEITYI